MIARDVTMPLSEVKPMPETVAAPFEITSVVSAQLVAPPRRVLFGPRSMRTAPKLTVTWSLPASPEAASKIVRSGPPLSQAPTPWVPLGRFPTGIATVWRAVVPAASVTTTATVVSPGVLGAVSVGVAVEALASEPPPETVLQA